MIRAMSMLGTALLVMLLIACAAYAPPERTPPGEEQKAKTKVLEAGAEMLQTEAPMAAAAIYLDGFHFSSGQIDHQMEAHHFCTQLNEDFIQCSLYSGNGRDALLTGVEYVISKRLFETLSAEERKLWHSHHYEVKSGALIAPGLPLKAQHELMEKLVSTYGKTWHTWDVDQPGGELPLGYPRLMMGFTADGQLNPDLQRRRDQLMGVSTHENRMNREDIPMPAVVPGANAWEQGEAYQLKLEQVPASEKRRPGQSHKER